MRAIILMAGFLLGGTAEAAAEVPVPVGWNIDDEVPTQARSRARAWAGASGYTLIDVASPASTDSFAETLAVLEVERAMSETAMNDLNEGHAALVEVLDPLRSSPGDVEAFTIQARPDGAVLRGQWQDNDQTIFAGLAPSGATQTLVLLAVRGQEATLYRPMFDVIVEDMDGVAPPLVPFPVAIWRAGTFLAWIVFVAGVYGVGYLPGHRAVDHRFHARRTSIIVAVSAVIVAFTVHAALAGEQAALIAAEVDRFSLTLQTGAMGMAGAILVLGLGFWLARERVVQSAPTASAFAGRGRLPKVPRLYDPAGVDLVRVPSAIREAISVPASPAGELEHHSLAELAKDPTPATLIAAASDSGLADVDDDSATRPHRALDSRSPTPIPAKPTAQNPASPPPRRSQSPAGPLPIPADPMVATTRSRPLRRGAPSPSQAQPPPGSPTKLPRPKPPGTGSTPVTGIPINRGRNRGEGK